MTFTFPALLPTSVWLAKLAEGTGVVNVIGDDSDAQNTNEDRIVWIPQDLDQKVLGYRESGTSGGSGAKLDFKVAIYAGSFDALIQRSLDLYAWIDMLFGPAKGSPTAGGGYTIGKSSQPKGGTIGSAGWGLTVPIALTGPYPRQQFGSGTVRHVPFKTQATDTDFADPAVVVDNPGKP